MINTFKSSILLSSRLTLLPTPRPINQKTSQYHKYKHFATDQHLKMPLVVPGITSGGEQNKTDEWSNKLVGKKIGDNHDAIVCSFYVAGRHRLNDLPDLCKGRLARGNSNYRARTNGYQGFQGE